MVQTMNFKERLALECGRCNSDTLAFTYHTFHSRVLEYHLKPPTYSITGVYSYPHKHIRTYTYVLIYIHTRNVDTHNAAVE